jgi:predicted O-methyltransferase YrrM
VDDKITFRLGMADKLLKEMVLDPALLGSFDLVFIDADKENYVIYAEYALKLLKSGGSLLVDNTLWKGLVAYPKPHDNGAMHVHQFNQWIMETYGNSCSIIPAWDGLSIVVKK